MIMTKPRRTVAYLILVLLILLVVAIIGGLAAVLFNMKPPVPKRHIIDNQTLVPLLTNTVSDLTPIAELTINIPPEELTKTVESAKQSTGVIPTVCDGYGPQVQNRDAFWGPTTHTVAVRPSRITFTIDLGDRKATGGPNNIR